MQDWWQVQNAEDCDSPALLLYKDRIQQNIKLAKEMIGDTNRLRPHVKTNKIAEVCLLMLDACITKFKCATIAEAEMLGMVKAQDVLLAYQPVGPKQQRFVSLANKYPDTKFSCLIDNAITAHQFSVLAKKNELILPVYIDVNVGMNRTGIAPQKIVSLIEEIKKEEGISIAGLHVYDGHLHDTDFAVRKQKSDAAFESIKRICKEIESILQHNITIIAGGTPTFPVHLLRQDVECSPGTFVFWDWGYKHELPDEPFEYAALLLSRVISILDEERICIDLGHKSVAAENPLPRVHFLNAPEVVPLSQSEEHMVLKVPDSKAYNIGDVMYGVPVHICPTVALYDWAYVVNEKEVKDRWKIVARDRAITI